jgi:hypothetical protein
MNIQLDTLSIREVQAQCYMTAFEHGFHAQGERIEIDQKLLLAIGELIEAQNEIRSGHSPQEVYYHPGPTGWPPSEKPEGFGIELADAVIRIMDLAEVLNLDLQSLMAVKMNYNEGRPYKHGKQF